MERCGLIQAKKNEIVLQIKWKKNELQQTKRACNGRSLDPLLHSEIKYSSTS